MRGCNLVPLRGADLVVGDAVRERVSIVQRKTGQPVQFEVSENTRQSIPAAVASPEMRGCRALFPSRLHDSPHLSMWQYARLIRDWVRAIGLDPSSYGTHSLRRTKAALIYRKTGNLRAVQLLLGHTKVDSTVRYLGVELEDALSIFAKAWRAEPRSLTSAGIGQEAAAPGIGRALSELLLFSESSEGSIAVDTSAENQP